MVALANFNPIWFVRRVRLLFASLLLWFAVPHHAICKPRELRVPPVGETTSVKVLRGASVDVSLQAVESGGNNPLAYEVVSNPQHGRLGDLQQADRNRQGSASIVYTHDDDENSKEDEFTFRARSLGGRGVSSPIKVKLQIVDAPPQLQVTPRADFSAVAGESDRQQIILANVGGGLIEGRVAPKDPFHVEGEDRFSLGRRAMTNIVIRFSPTRTETVGPQKLTPAPSDPGATITLRGEVSAPFEASAEPLKVDATGARSGLIVISNLASAPLAVDLELTPKDAAEVSSREEIPPQSTAQIPVTISSEKAGGAFNLNVALSCPFHRQDVTFEVPAVPPRLELVTPVLDFRGSDEAAVVVKNSGGTEGRFDLGLPPDVKSLSKTQTFAVAARTNTSVSLRWERSEDECADDAMVKTAGLSTNLDVLRPARLKVVTDKLDFRKSVEAELVLTNSGDAAGRFVLALPPSLEAGDQSQKWEVPARGEIRVQLRQISPDAQTEGRPVSVNLGVDGRTVVPVVVAEVPPGWPWQLNKDVKLARNSEKPTLIMWLASKENWTDAQLEKISSGEIQRSDSHTKASKEGLAQPSWWQRLYERIRSIWHQLRAALGGARLSQLDEPPVVQDENTEWQNAEVPEADLKNESLRWRITAVRRGQIERLPASDDFQIQAFNNELVSFFASSPNPPPREAIGNGGSYVRITSRRLDTNGLTLALAQAWQTDVADIRIEEIVGIRGTESGPPVYETRAPSVSEAEFLSKGDYLVAGETELRAMSICFKSIPRGGIRLFRLVSMSRTGQETISEPFLVEGEPKTSVPWRYVFLAIFAGALLVMWRELRKRRPI